MTASTWAWVALAAAVVVLLAVDLLLFGSRRGPISFRRAAAWSVWWMTLGLAFGGLLLLVDGRQAAEEYLTGFVLEKSLSLDNLFVFALVLSYFDVPRVLHRRVLYWGIAGAIALRALFILAGGALLDAFHWMTYVFGVFLVVTAARMALRFGDDADPRRNRTLRVLGRLLPMTDGYAGERFLVRSGRSVAATPLLAALVAIAVFDVVFAVDSIPAIFAITRDTFIVFAANAFSLLGLAALYFLLVEMLERFAHLHYGLAGALGVVGLKMVLADVITIPASLALLAVLVALSLAGLTSLATRTRPHGRAGSEAGSSAVPSPTPYVTSDRQSRGAGRRTRPMLTRTSTKTATRPRRRPR